MYFSAENNVSLEKEKRLQIWVALTILVGGIILEHARACDSFTTPKNK